jgi:hypothetical protein
LHKKKTEKENKRTIKALHAVGFDRVSTHYEPPRYVFLKKLALQLANKQKSV